MELVSERALELQFAFFPARQREQLRRVLYLVLLSASCLGLALSGWAHVEACLGLDPNRRIGGFWAVHLLLLALMLPVIVEVLAGKAMNGLLSCSRAMRMGLYFLLTYYGANFYFFLYWAADHLTSSATWRMMSSGLVLLFAITAVYYRTRLTNLK